MPRFHKAWSLLEKKLHGRRALVPPDVLACSHLPGRSDTTVAQHIFLLICTDNKNGEQCHSGFANVNTLPQPRTFPTLIQPQSDRWMRLVSHCSSRSDSSADVTFSSVAQQCPADDIFTRTASSCEGERVWTGHLSQ